MCPDEDAVWTATAKLFPEIPIERRALDAKVIAHVNVTIRPVLGGHEALIRVTRPRPGERTITVKSTDCRGLDEALAVSLVLLIDPEREFVDSPATETSPPQPTTAQSPSPPVPAVRSTSPNLPEQLAPNLRNQRPGRYFADVRGGGIASLGMLAEPAAGAFVGVTLRHKSGLALEAQGLRLWAQPAIRAPGQVDVSLWGALVGPCYERPIAMDWRARACVHYGFGEQRAVAAGYRQDGSALRPWSVFASTVSADHVLSRALSSDLSIGFFSHLRREGFTIAGLGTVAEPKVAGVLMQLGLRFGGQIF